jgi:zinc-binding alcohol dehydrogenase family protein
VKALTYQSAHTLANFAIALTEEPEPTVRDRDVLVEVKAIGINPGEAQIRSTRSAEAGGRVLLGFEFAGVVKAVGREVTRFTIGDAVFGTGDASRDGAWAERVATDERVIAHMPRDLSFTDAASVPIGAATAWEAVFRDQKRLPDGVERVLVVGGAGAVGSFATQLLKATTKATVIATASRPESQEWCRQMGAELVLDHAEDLAAQLSAAGIASLDLILSTANSAANIATYAKILRPFGHLAVVDGVPDFTPLMDKSASIHLEMVFSRIMNGFLPEQQSEILQTAAALIEAGKLKPIASTVLHGLTSETMHDAHALVEKRQTAGKIVIAV